MTPRVVALIDRPMLRVPVEGFRSLTDSQRRSLLAQELAHSHRRDDHVRWLERLDVSTVPGTTMPK